MLEDSKPEKPEDMEFDSFKLQVDQINSSVASATSALARVNGENMKATLVPEVNRMCDDIVARVFVILPVVQTKVSTFAERIAG